MNVGQPWKRLLEIVRVEGNLGPLSEDQLNRFEAVNKIKLPRSYREFCKVFGPGGLRSRIWLHITTPGVDVSAEQSITEQMKISIEVLNKEIWSRDFFELDEYCANPQLIRRGLFFGRDIYTHHYFWNQDEVTDRVNNEMAVYVIYREMEIHRLAETFESFVLGICLDKGIPNHGKLEYDPPLFNAVSRV